MRKFLFLSVALACLASHAAAAILPPEKLLPDDTLVMVTLPDFNKIRDIYQHSPQGRWWNDPSMKAFKEKFLSKLNAQYLTPLEHDLGVSFNDYTNLPQGQVTFAMVQNGVPTREGQSAGYLLLLDTGDKSTQLKTNLADLKKKWVDAGKTIRTEKIRDVDFSVIVLSHDDVPKSLKKSESVLPGGPDTTEPFETKPEPKREIYIGQAESLLIVGNAPKVLEEVLASMGGGTVKTLGELSAYQANLGLFRNAPAYGWVNAKAIVDLMGHSSDDSKDDSNPFALKPDKIISALGLNALRTAAFNYTYTEDGAQFNLALSVPEAGRTGIFKILSGESKEYNPPAFVPADAVKFQRWRLDGQKTYAALRKIIGEISPAGLGGLDLILGSAEIAAKEKDPSFDLNKNLFGNLGDDIISYEKLPRAGQDSGPSIMLINSPNPEQLASALKSVLSPYFGQPGATTAKREFLGHQIYSIPLPPAPAMGDAPPTPRSLSYASGGGYLAITGDPSLLEEYLRSSESQAKSLRETPGLSDAAQKVGGSGTSLFGYSNEAESMRASFDSAKKDAAGINPMGFIAPLAAALGVGDMKVNEWLDVSLLPTFDKVSKYFYFSVYSGSANSEGLNFKFFAPVPPQLKQQP